MTKKKSSEKNVSNQLSLFGRANDDSKSKPRESSFLNESEPVNHDGISSAPVTMDSELKNAVLSSKAPGSSTGFYTNDETINDKIVLDKLVSWSVTELVEQIKYHDCLYSIGKSVISDPVYDQITIRLKMLDPENPILSKTYETSSEDDDSKDDLTSPGEVRRGQVGKNGSQKVIHNIAMLSLAKAYSAEEVFDWAKNIKGDLVASPKMDGLACSLRYDEKGDLRVASTRGNGQAGDDITANALYIKDIPKHINASNVEIRGEVYMPLSSFEHFKNTNQADVKSARNLAVGGLKQKSASETAKYGLSFFGYEMFGESFESEMAKLARIAELGFHAVPHECLVRPAVPQKESVVQREVREKAEHALIFDYTQRMLEERETWDFDADGLVFKTNLIEEQDQNNVTLHHPKYAIAFKFQGEEGSTILRSIEWQVAKQGIITPVGVFDTIILNGAALKRATLVHAGHIEHFPDPMLPRDPANPHEIQTRPLKLGSRILVTRRGGVIPCIERPHEVPESAQPIELPKTCPSCGAPVRIMKSEKADPVKTDKDYVSGKYIYFLACSDPENCPSTNQSLIENYVKCINCLGFGSKIIEYLYDVDLLKTPADLYRLSIRDIAFAIAQSKGSDAKDDPEIGVMPQKLYDAIQAARHMSLSQFLEALSIPNLGKEMSRELEKAFGTIDRVLAASPEELIRVMYVKNKAEVIYNKIKTSVRAYDESVNQWLDRIGVKSNYNKAVRTAFCDENSIRAASINDITISLIEERKQRDAKKLETIQRGFSYRRPVIDDLLKYVVIGQPATDSLNDGPFAGMSFLFTGSLASMKREEAQARVEALGGKSASSVTKTLSVLVATNNTSTKWKKAEDLNQKGTASIELWTEETFLEKLREAESR